VLTLSRRIERPKSSHSGEVKRTAELLATPSQGILCPSAENQEEADRGEASSNSTVTTPTGANLASRFMR